METDQQTKFAQQNDPILTAKIVREIEELERNYRLAEGPMSERFIREVTAVIRKSAPEPWEVIESDWSVLLASPDWKSPNGLGRGDAWFEISEVAADDEDHSWIAAAVSAGPTELGLELSFRKGLVDAANAVTRETINAAKLKEIGFKRDDTGKRLFLPLPIDRMRLSKGYAENDLTDALAPVRKAVELVTGAKTDFDKLVEAIRKKAKGR